jgi:hypothetical protein
VTRIAAARVALLLHKYMSPPPQMLARPSTPVGVFALSKPDSSGRACPRACRAAVVSPVVRRRDPGELKGHGLKSHLWTASAAA